MTEETTTKTRDLGIVEDNFVLKERIVGTPTRA